MNDALLNAFDLYEKELGESFPVIPLALSRSEKEILDIINECVESGKTVYDLGLCSLDTDIQY